MEQSAAWHEKTGTVIRPVQAVSEDIFIWTVRPRRIVNCLIAPPRNILTYLLTYLHLEYSLWTDNVDFVHICYDPCDLFDCGIFNYEIMPER